MAALTGCKKDPQPTPEEFTLTADKTEAYAGDFITVTSNYPIKEFSAKDNLEFSDFTLNVETSDDYTLKVYPGSGSMRISSSTAHIDSDIKLTVTTVNDETKTLDLKGKSWFFETKVGDKYGAGLAYSDVKAGDIVYFSLTSTDGKDLVTAEGFSVTFEGNAYKYLGVDDDIKTYHKCEVLGGASDYDLRAAYKSRIVLVSPKSVK